MIWGLFCLGLSLQAQSLYIEKPARGAVLQDEQEFVVEALGPQPDRVDFYLNGRLMMARREPPYVFTIKWNTRYKNTVRLVATYADGSTSETTRDFDEIKVDVEEELEVFQFFPFIEKPQEPGGITLSYNDAPITPQTLEPATNIPLELIIALDTSGSMMFSFDELEQPVRGLIEWAQTRNFPLTFLIFDTRPKLIKLDQFPDSLKSLYRERPSSAVWDTVATASNLFKESPRRILLMITDGGDQGSKHTKDTAAVYLRKSGASLIWVSPARVPNRELFNLCKESGGFTVFTNGRNPWPGVVYLMDNQFHVVAPDAGWPMTLKARKGRAWYPRWEK